jgi:adenine deaminase
MVYNQIIVKKDRKKLIDTAAERVPADLVIRNGKIADVYTGRFIETGLAINGGLIAGLDEYEGRAVIDAGGQYLPPVLFTNYLLP